MIATLRSKTILHFLIIFHLSQTTAFKIIDVEDLPEPRLEQNFDFKDNPAEYSIVLDSNEIERENLKQSVGFNELNLKDNGFKKILVKRKIPHGLAPTGIEYDQKFNTVYKPLVRIHQTKSINQFLNEITPNEDSKHEVIFMLSNKPNYNKLKLNYDLNHEHLKKPEVIINSFNFNDKSKLLKLIHERNRNNNKEPLSNAFEISENNPDYDDYKHKLLNEVQKKIRLVKAKSKRLIAFAQVLKALNTMLRSQFEKSGEVNDPLAPGQEMLERDDKQKKPKKWIPHYPPWNYWTYKKTIHEDECPGTQVKIGNMCIWTPPH